MWCYNLGEHIAGAVRMLGYAKTYHHDVLQQKVRYDDIRLRKKDADVRKNLRALDAAVRESDAERIEELEVHEGLKGHSVLFKYLGYVSTMDLCCWPALHCMTAGLCKAIYELLFRVLKRSKDIDCPYIPHAVRRLMTKWGAEMRRTGDFDRGYRDIVENHRNYKMVEWLRWCDCWSKYVTGPQFKQALLEHLPEEHQRYATVVCELLELLHEIVVTFCRIQQEDKAQSETENAFLERKKKVIDRFAKLVETEFGPKYCTPNLHSLACRALEQWKVRGPTGLEGELYVERACQQVKKRVKGRTTDDPEKTMAADILLDHGLFLFNLIHGKGQFKTIRQEEAAKGLLLGSSCADAAINDKDVEAGDYKR
jgi:hypothetical protein